MAVSIGVVLIGLFLLVLLGLSIVNLVRPDLFRFEVVGLRGSELALREMEERVETLKKLSDQQLSELPEESVEHGTIAGRQAFFVTTRRQTAEGTMMVVVFSAVTERSGPLGLRRVAVAAMAFHTDSAGGRASLPEIELNELAMQYGTDPLYERWRFRVYYLRSGAMSPRKVATANRARSTAG